MASPELDQNERERLVAQYAELATLAGGLAHEVKNPLSTILMNLELLVEELEGSQSPRDRRMLRKLQTIQRECRHLQEILEAFLQFARAGQLELVETDLNRVVREFIDFYQREAEQHGIEISPHLSADLPSVKLDESLMRQVLINLAKNAQDAMPNGGTLEVQTYERNGQVVLEMIDTGVGMDPEVQKKMFQVFYSTKPGGSGLGLPTVRKIIEAHRGTIRCDSEPGRGTRFTITLPTS